MKIFTGVTSTTKQNLQLGAGVITTEYTAGVAISEDSIIGATRGGGSFTATPTIRQVEADGLPTNTKGFELIDDWVITLQSTLIEFKKESLLLALGGGAKTTEEDQVIKITATNEVADTDYKNVFWIGNLADGRKAVIMVKNALSLAGLNFTITNKGEGTYPLNLTGHYDVSDTETAPFEVWIDNKSAAAASMSAEPNSEIE